MALLSNLLKQTLKHGGFKWFEFHINLVFDELISIPLSLRLQLAVSFSAS